MPQLSFIQIGKNGLTKNTFETLNNHFKTHQIVKVIVLKSARPEGKEGREKLKKYEAEILKHLGNYFTSRTIGFTIILRKWRKPRK